MKNFAETKPFMLDIEIVNCFIDVKFSFTQHCTIFGYYFHLKQDNQRLILN